MVLDTSALWAVPLLRSKPLRNEVCICAFNCSNEEPNSCSRCVRSTQKHSSVSKNILRTVYNCYRM